MNTLIFPNWVRVGIALLAAGLIDAAVQGQDKSSLNAQYTTETDILYRADGRASDAMRERCRLDLYFPREAKGFATVVWFHGGGLTQGNKSIPDALKHQGIAVVAPNYRLSPAAKSPEYVEDAAASVAWTFENIEKYGGSPERIFVAGHSAGGYLTSMIGLDKRWLQAHRIDANAIAGLIPFSGQSITHFTIRAERGIQDTQPIIDDMAPLFHVRKDAPPMLLISGDRNRELTGRYEETAYFWRMLKEVGHTHVELVELGGYNHQEMAAPAFPLLLKFVGKN